VVVEVVQEMLQEVQQDQVDQEVVLQDKIHLMDQLMLEQQIRVEAEEEQMYLQQQPQE
jgi:hypothetical protein